MKEKRKGHSRRRLFWLLGAVVFLLGGYISLPYAQDAFVNWWEDDPFTPLCDMPNLELAFADIDVFSTTVSTIRGDGSGLRVVDEFDNNGSSSFTVWQHQYILDWSPDENLLAYEKAEGDYASNLMIYAPDERLIEAQVPVAGNFATGSNGRFFQWTWAADGSGLFYTTYSYYRASIRVEYENWFGLSFEDNAQPTLIFLNLTEPIYSPNHELFVSFDMNGPSEYIDGEFINPLIIARLEADKLNYQELYRIEHEFTRTIQWMPNGRDVLLAGSFGVHLLNTESREIREISAIPYQWNNLVLSADSSELAWFDDAGIHIIDIASGEEVTLIPHQAHTVRLLTPDGYSNPTTKFNFIRVDEQHIYAIENDLLLVFDRESLSIVQEIRLAMRHDTREMNSVDYSYRLPSYFYGITPDNRYFSYLGKNSWFYLLDLESLEQCRLVKSDMQHFDWRIIPQEAE